MTGVRMPRYVKKFQLLKIELQFLQDAIAPVVWLFLYERLKETFTARVIKKTFLNKRLTIFREFKS